MFIERSIISACFVRIYLSLVCAWSFDAYPVQDINCAIASRAVKDTAGAGLVRPYDLRLEPRFVIHPSLRDRALALAIKVSEW